MFGLKKDRFKQIKTGHKWKFHGGIHPRENKSLTENIPVSVMPTPQMLVVPLKQHIGSAGEVIVKVGDHVLKGQPLTLCITNRDLAVHAPTSGTIKSIQLYTDCHPSGFKAPAIIIEPDGKDEWVELKPISNYNEASAEELIAKIRDCAIVGMGGAGFPAHAKIASAMGKTRILIINGCECEPYITCDDRLMQEKSDEIITGVKILQHILKPEITLIAIEDNKPNAIKAMKVAAEAAKDVYVRVLPTKYPTGAARPLIRILTGYEVGYTHRSTDFGIMMQNIGSTYYIKRAIINGEPLIERIVTITGNNFKQHANVIVKNGTLVRHVIDYFKLKNSDEGKIILGGPMMGFAIGSLDVPLIKTVTCVIAPDNKELPSNINVYNCIKCGKCQKVCPSFLTPYKMYGHVKSGNIDEFEKCTPKDCIECGCCAFICPSKIPLVEYFRIGKAAIRKNKAEASKKEQIKAATIAKENQIKFEQEERAARINNLKNQNSENSAKQKVAEALARAKKAKELKEQITTTNQTAVATEEQKQETKLDPKEIARKQALALAKAKAQALKEQKESQTDSDSKKTEASSDATVTSSSEGTTDPKELAKKKALAIAKAKAQALKEQKESQTNSDSKKTEANSEATVTSSSEGTTDPKELAKKKALAIAKAKAQALKEQKENQSQTASDSKKTEASSEATNDSSSEVITDPRELAKKKALAIAKAKAQALKEQKESQTASDSKKTEANSEATNDSSSEVITDPRELAKKKALAIAKAKAQALKEQKENQSQTTSDSKKTEANSEATNDSASEFITEPRELAKKKALAIAKAKAQALKEQREKEETITKTEVTNDGTETEKQIDSKELAKKKALALALAKKKQMDKER